MYGRFMSAADLLWLHSSLRESVTGLWIVINRQAEATAAEEEEAAALALLTAAREEEEAAAAEAAAAREQQVAACCLQLVHTECCKSYNVFKSGVFLVFFRELEWKSPILSWRAPPKTLNALYCMLY